MLVGTAAKGRPIYLGTTEKTENRDLGWVQSLGYLRWSCYLNIQKVPDRGEGRVTLSEDVSLAKLLLEHQNTGLIPLYSVLYPEVAVKK